MFRIVNKQANKIKKKRKNSFQLLFRLAVSKSDTKIVESRTFQLIIETFYEIKTLDYELFKQFICYDYSFRKFIFLS